LIVILGTTILTTVLSYLVERTIDQQNRKLLRRKLTEPESA